MIPKQSSWPSPSCSSTPHLAPGQAMSHHSKSPWYGWGPSALPTGRGRLCSCCASAAGMGVPIAVSASSPSLTPASCCSVARSQGVQQVGLRLQHLEFVLPYCDVSAAFQKCGCSQVRLVCQKRCPSWARAGNKSSLLGRAEQKAEAPRCLLWPCRCDTLH